MKIYPVFIFSALLIIHAASAGKVLNAEERTLVKKVHTIDSDQPTVLQCNYDLIQLYVKAPSSKPEDIKQFCPSVEHSCCSVLQLRDVAKEYSEAKTQVLQSYYQVKQLVDIISNIPEDTIRKFVEDWRVVPVKRKTGVGNNRIPVEYEKVLADKADARTIEVDYSRFLERQFQLISGFACSICNKDHAKDFVVDVKQLKIKEVTIQTSHCDALFSQNHQLYNAFNISLKWVKIANIVDHFKGRKMGLSYNEYLQKGHSFFHNIKKCMGRHEHDSENNLSQNCKLICEKLFSFNSIVIPYRILEALRYIRQNIGEYFYSERPEVNANALSTDNEIELVRDQTLSEAHAVTTVNILPHKGINYPVEELVDHATLETASGQILIAIVAKLMLVFLVVWF